MELSADYPDFETALARVSDGIEANVPAATLSAELLNLEAASTSTQELRANFLLLRGIVTNRLGLAMDALGDLTEAKAMFRCNGDVTGATRADRETARVFAWRGKSREAALSLVEALAAYDEIDAADCVRLLADAGQLNLEIGRFAAASDLLSKAVKRAEGRLTPDKGGRILVSLAQAMIGLGQFEAAEQTLARVRPETVSSRTRHLLGVERARTMVRRQLLDQAEEELAKLREVSPGASESFEAIEIVQVAAELAIAHGQLQDGLAYLDIAVARYAEDDLAGREIIARVLRAEILFQLGKEDEASDGLISALRRAVFYGLVGHETAVRAKLAERKISPFSIATNTTSLIASSSSQRFVRRRNLGQGGIGSVSTACDLETGDIVALKRLPLSTIYDPDERRRRTDSARTEAGAASRIVHPGIGRVYGFIIDDNGDGLLVREMIEGPTLRDILGQPVTISRKFALLEELSHAIIAMHGAGIVHCDLKPENIVLRGELHPVIIDLGAASWSGSPSNADFSPLYAAPEQMLAKPTDARADLYALGMIAFELIVGHRPERLKGGLLGLIYRRLMERKLLQDLNFAGAPSTAAVLVIGLLSINRRRRPSMARLVSSFRGAG